MSHAVTDDTPTDAIPVTRSRRARALGWVNARRPKALWINILLIVLLLLAIVMAFLVIGNPGSSNTQVRTVAVTRGTVTATVSGSGNTESSLSTPVSFQGNGTVTAIDVKPGDTVTLGQTLATIDPTAAKATLATAQAQLDGAKANLAQASSGPTVVKQQQDQLAITTAQQGVDNANASLDAARRQLALDQTSTSAAVSNAQQKLSNDRTSTNTAIQQAQAQLNSDTTAQNAAVSQAQAAYNSCQQSLVSSLTGSSASASATPTAQPTSSNCTAQKDALTNAENTRTATLAKDRLAVQAAQNTQNSTLSADQQAVTTAQQTRNDTLAKDDASITTSQQSVTSSQGMVTSAQLAAQADLHPMTPDQIAQVQATVDSAQVQVSSARLAVDQTTLKAPQAGVVLAVNGKVGESSGSGTSSSTTTSGTGSTGTGGGSSSAGSASSSSSSTGFITIANLSQLAVTANIAEADAAKIKLGQPARVTFPATGTTATGSVIQITPQSTVTNNVVLYPVQVSLDTAPAGVGVGATATLAVTTGSVTSVLTAPTSAITTVGNRHTVTVRRNGTDTVVPVEIGLSGDTTTEITSGVSEGDLLVLPTVAAATGTGGTGGFPRTGG